MYAGIEALPIMLVVVLDGVDPVARQMAASSLAARGDSDAMKTKKIRLSTFQEFSIVFEGDIYELAQWLLRLDLARSTATHVHRHTVHGLANRYSMLTGTSLDVVCRRLVAHGYDLGATIEPDEDVGGRP